VATFESAPGLVGGAVSIDTKGARMRSGKTDYPYKTKGRETPGLRPPGHLTDPVVKYRQLKQNLDQRSLGAGVARDARRGEVRREPRAAPSPQQPCGRAPARQRPCPCSCSRPGPRTARPLPRPAAAGQHDRGRRSRVFTDGGELDLALFLVAWPAAHPSVMVDFLGVDREHVGSVPQGHERTAGTERQPRLEPAPR
jgi:hypothetical protein